MNLANNNYYKLNEVGDLNSDKIEDYIQIITNEADNGNRGTFLFLDGRNGKSLKSVTAIGLDFLKPKLFSKKQFILLAKNNPENGGTLLKIQLNDLYSDNLDKVCVGICFLVFFCVKFEIFEFLNFNTLLLKVFPLLYQNYHNCCNRLKCVFLKTIMV